MAKGLSEQGDICYIHNGSIGKKGISVPEYTKLDGIGTVVDYPAKGVWYVSPFRNNARLISDLKRWYRPERMNWVIVEAPYLPFYYLNILAARKAGYRVAAISHEWLGTFLNKNHLKKWGNHLYSRVFGYSVDAILPISEYIIRRIQKFRKPYLKIPVEADFADFTIPTKKGSFFLYCVSAEYIRVIRTVIDGFSDFAKQHSEYHLILVLAGGQGAIDDVCRMIEDMKLSRLVEIRYGIPFDEFMYLNRTASGLVVPLDPDYEQDKARFSQKIAEYLASGTAIISNDVGEVKTYFKDKVNIILNEYSSSGFCSSFEWIATNPDKSIEIGLKGFELGREHFDYRLCGKQLHDFLSDRHLFSASLNS
ncbi:hypothetical protein QET93_013050 [Akkermansia sp. N21116]|uniref:hypothetical protein n=1 Tax=Akkermansia sp. N21116 TaxID=3040764 RepID=UPI00244E6FF8|nr:hypothetical protein [Akkermansia sp. N21116]WPX40452.1 hypothetical protein QET93_013050 [Akkermansia sp. N21116]